MFKEVDVTRRQFCGVSDMTPLCFLCTLLCPVSIDSLPTAILSAAWSIVYPGQLGKGIHAQNKRLLLDTIARCRAVVDGVLRRLCLLPHYNGGASKPWSGQTGRGEGGDTEDPHLLISCHRM